MDDCFPDLLTSTVVLEPWRIILASNTQPHETRWPALQQAGIDDLFSVALLSYLLGVRKPDPVFYRLVLAAAGAPPGQVLFVGDNLQCDVIAPLAHGMRAVLVRLEGLRPGERLPGGALMIAHVRELPALLGRYKPRNASDLTGPRDCGITARMVAVSGT